MSSDRGGLLGDEEKGGSRGGKSRGGSSRFDWLKCLIPTNTVALVLILLMVVPTLIVAGFALAKLNSIEGTFGISSLPTSSSSSSISSVSSSSQTTTPVNGTAACLALVTALRNIPHQTCDYTRDCPDATSFTIVSSQIVLADTDFPGEPQHCNLVIREGNETLHNWRLQMPGSWNNILFAAGGSGFDGSTVGGISVFINNYNATYDGFLDWLPLGYVMSGTDAWGEQAILADSGGSVGTPFVAHRDRVRNYAYRARHIHAKLHDIVLKAYYGSSTRRANGPHDDKGYYAYHMGCSNGGRNTAMEAQRFPDDYHGYVAGCPVTNLFDITAGLTWKARAEFPGSANPSNAVIPNIAIYQIIENAVLAKCGNNGLIDHPESCNMNALVDLPICVNGVFNGSCVTLAQAQVMQTIWEGTQIDGQPYAGMRTLPGMEVSGGGYGWIGRNTTSIIANNTQYLTSGIFWNPAVSYPMWFFKIARYPENNPLPFMWNNITFKHSDFNSAALTSTWTDTVVSTDFSQFARDSNRKIIFYGHWNDGIVPATYVRNFFNDVTTSVGGLLASARQMRFYMVPYGGHCGVGPLCQFDFVTAIRNWVEKEIAPGSIQLGMCTDSRQRITCPYPLEPALKTPSADPDLASSYYCRVDLEDILPPAHHHRGIIGGHREN